MSVEHVNQKIRIVEIIHAKR